VAFITLTFAGGVTASVQISRLAPRKLRETEASLRLGGDPVQLAQRRVASTV
jgi:hypothetical protein